MYSPAIQPEIRARIFNLAKKQRRPMTKIVNEILTEHFNSKKHKAHKEAVIADYEPDYESYSDLCKVKCASCYSEIIVDDPSGTAFCEHCQSEVYLIPA